MLQKIINKVLRKEEISRTDGVIYLHRWTLFRTSTTGIFGKFGLGDIRIYIHKFTGDDCASLHDHPNNFISVGLKGQYLEEEWIPKEKDSIKKIYKAPFFRRLKASHTHRVSLINGRPAWTLVIMSPKIREWGFFRVENGKRRFIHWKDYVQMFGGAGDKC